MLRKNAPSILSKSFREALIPGQAKESSDTLDLHKALQAKDDEIKALKQQFHQTEFERDSYLKKCQELEEEKSRYWQTQNDRQTLDPSRPSAIYTTANERIQKRLAQDDDVGESKKARTSNDAQETVDNDDEDKIDVPIKIHYVYVIKLKGRRDRKGVILWGISTDPYHRWDNYTCTYQEISNKTHEMVVILKLTADNVPLPDKSLHQNSLICERAIGDFKADFTPHPNAKSGNGRNEDKENNETFEANKKYLKTYVEPALNFALENRNRMDDVDMFECSIDGCGKEYLKLLHLRVHVKSYHSDEKFECTICHAEFDTFNQLCFHRSTTHNKPPPCPKCKNQYADRGGLKRHLIREHKYSELEAKFAAGMKMNKQNVKDLEEEREKEARRRKKFKLTGELSDSESD